MRADRLLSILMILQTKGQMTAKQLADQMEVSTRTIYRDLDALSGAGVPVYAERGPNGGCMLLESYRTNLTGLREREVRALFMLTVPGLVADLGVEKEAENALLKLTAALPTPFQQDAAQVQQRLHLDSAPWFQPEEPIPFLRLLHEAVWAEQRVRIDYRQANGRWIKRLIDPLGLVAKASTWYVVCQAQGDYLQVYRVSRIQEAVLTTSRFLRPADFDLTDYWRRWVQRITKMQEQTAVTLQVSPTGLKQLQFLLGDAIHQHLAEAEADKRGWLTMTLTFGSLDDACRQLLGLGTAVHIIEPVVLRQQMVDMAQEIVAAYRKEK